MSAWEEYKKKHTLNSRTKTSPWKEYKNSRTVKSPLLVGSDAQSKSDPEDYETKKIELKAAADAEQAQVLSPDNLLLKSFVTHGSPSTITQGMQGIFQYIDWLKQSPEWLKYNQYTAAEQEEEKKAELAETAKWAKENPVIGSAASVGTSVLSGADYLSKAIETATVGQPVASSTPGLSEITQAIRGGVSEDMSDTGKFIYNTAMSGVDSLVAGLGGSGGAVLLGLGAASNTYNDIKARGGSEKQALVGGAVSGIFESLFEKVSIGNFSALKEMPVDSLKTLFKNYAKSAGVNFTEEALTEVANIAYDYFAMGDLSQYELMARSLEEQYLAQGMSASEAKEKAEKETKWAFLKQVGEAGLSGALMSFGFTTVGTAASEYNAYKTGQGYKDNSAQQHLVQLALQGDKNSQSYKMAENIAPKLDARKDATVGSREIGRLENMMGYEAAMAAEDAEKAEKREWLKTIVNNKTYNINDTKSLINYAMSFSPETASYQMGEQLKGKKNITSAEEGALIRTISQDIERGNNKANPAAETISASGNGNGRVTAEIAPTAAQTAKETVSREPVEVIRMANAQAQQNEKTAAETQQDVSESNTKIETQDMRAKLAEKLESGEITEEQYDAALESISELESLAYEEGESLDTYNPNMMKKTEVNTDGRSNLSDEGSEWAASQSAGEQARQLAEGAGRDQSRQVQNQRAASRRDDVARYYESTGKQPVNAKEYLGSDSINKVSTLQEVPAEMIAADSELSSIAEEIRSMGLTPHIFVGDVRLTNGNTMDALIRDNDVFVRADSDAFTATQNWEHEKAHAIFRQSPGIESELYKQIVGKGEAARRKLHQTIKKYRDAYHGIYDVDQNGNEIWNDEVLAKIMQEVLADAYAGKDTFAQGVEEYADIARDAASQIEERGGEVRGPPDGAMSVVRDRKSVGGYRVIVDRDIFSGVPYDQRNRVLRDFLFENLRGAEIETLIDQNVLYIAQKNKDLQKLVRPGVPMKERKYNARQDIASHFDEVTAASKLDDIEKNKKPTERPNRGDVQKRIVEVEIPSWDSNGKLNDVSIWQVELSVPLDLISGNRTSYDISSLSDKTKNTHSLLYRLQKAGLDVDRVSLQRTIAENLKVVKPKVRENFSASISKPNANEMSQKHNKIAEQELVKIFGTTADFAEAGFILSNGDMLKLTDDDHRGERIYDHRAIGLAYGVDVDLSVNHGFNNESNKYLDEFVENGGIRFDAGEPSLGTDIGLQLSSTVPLTKEQEQIIRDLVEWKRDREVQFESQMTEEDFLYDGPLAIRIDFGGDSNYAVGSASAKDLAAWGKKSLEYAGGNINADRIISDIRHYYHTGEVREPSFVAQFRFSADNAAQKSGADPIEAMPTKARQVMERAEKKLQRSLADVLNLPKMPDGVMDEVSREISKEFLETGTVSDETIDRTFEKVYSAIEDQVEEQYGVDAEDRFKWAERDYVAEIGKHLAEMRLVRRYANEKAAQSQQKEQDKALTVNDLTRLYKEKKAAQRAADKAVARNLLTESDNQQVNRLLRGDIDLDMLRPGVDNVRGITEVYNAKLEQEKIARQLRRWNAQRKENLRNLADELLATASNWKDKKSGWKYSRETMDRNFFDIIPDEKVAKKVVDTLIAPIHKSAAAATKMKNDYRKRVNKLNLSRKVAEGNKISEAAAVQLLGEAEDNIKHLQDNPFLTERDGRTLEDWQGIVRDMWEQNPGLDAAKIRGAVNEFRAIYDELFEQMNEVRMRNGYEPVNYRKGYFPHFQNTEGDTLLAKFGKSLGINTAAMQLPTTINGLTHNFKPGIQWFGSAQQRLGSNTVFDAVEGFDSYIEGVADVIHQTDNIQRLRAFASQVRYRTSEEGIRKRVDEIRNDPTIAEEDKHNRIEKIYADGKFELGNLAVELDEYTNLLAGKKSRHDRDMEQRMGRRMYAIMKWAEKQIGANMVAVNPASWLTNFIPIQQAWSVMSTRDLLSGMYDTLRSYKQDDGFAASSAFLTNRRGSDPLVKTWLEQTSGTLSKPMEWIDTFTADTIVRARYNENIRRGLSEDAAMADADAFAASIMADRSKGAMPTIFSQTNPLTKLFTQFQLEVNNQLSFVFKDMPKTTREKGLKALALALFKFALGGWLYNELYEWLIGRRPALDPINMVSETVSDIGEHGVYTAGVNLAGSVAEELPFIGGLLGGGRLPISSALPDKDNLWRAISDSNWAPEKRVSTGVKELLKPALYLGMPFGGGQVKKVVEGVSAIAKGGSYSVDRNGEDILQYPVYNSTPGEAGVNAVRALLFGKSSLPAAREWVDSDFDSLGAKQTALYDEMREGGASGRDVFEMIRNVEAADTNMDKIRAVAETSFDEPLKILAMANAMSESQFEKYRAATNAGVSTIDYVSLLQAIAANSASRGSKSANQEDVKSALNASNLTAEQKRAIWNSYSWKAESPW